MFWFTVQLAILLLAAYFAGAMLGCMTRRTFFPHTLKSDTQQRVPVAAPVAMPASRPVAAAAAAPVTQPTRFERALTGTAEPVVTGVPMPQAAPAPAPKMAAPAPVAPIPPAPVPAAPAPAVNAAVTAAVTAVAAAARAQQLPAGILPAAMGTSGPATVSAPSAPIAPPAAVAAPAAPAPVATPAPVPVVAVAASAAPQDLTRIRAIDDAMHKALGGLGVKSFADIAGWKPEDVARISGALKIPGRIEQENWIEQAQILAKGGETYYSRRKLKGELPTSRPTPDEGERITVRVPAATRPADAPAAPAPAPVATPAPAVAPVPAMQAASSAAAQAASAVQAAQAAVASAPAAAAAVAASAVAAAAKFAAPAVAAPGSTDRPIGMARDNLQRIAGINGEVERLLNVQGVTRYMQVADWSPSDVSRFDRLLGFEGRIARENWIEQAQILAKGGETAYARDYARRTAEAARPPAQPAVAPPAAVAAASPSPAERTGREDLSTLRSVRSEAYRGPDAAAGAGPGRPGDDLKRIRGVGVLIEKKLNALGVTRYDQVANWTQSDIERFSEKLDFNGRIERENWVEQARILSAGGQTEFSQRVDRGEVETSRAKT